MKKINISNILLIIAIIVIIGMAYFMHIKKNDYENEIKNLQENVNTMNIQIEKLQEKIDLVKEAVNTNEKDNESIKKEEKAVKYEFTSADNAAAEGNAKILKIYEMDENKIEFYYNSGYDFEKSTIDREISGIAQINDEQKFEFEEIIGENEYKLVFELDEEKTTMKIYEYEKENLLGWINLYR